MVCVCLENNVVKNDCPHVQLVDSTSILQMSPPSSLQTSCEGCSHNRNGGDNTFPKVTQQGLSPGSWLGHLFP